MWARRVRLLVTCSLSENTMEQNTEKWVPDDQILSVLVSMGMSKNSAEMVTNNVIIN